MLLEALAMHHQTLGRHCCSSGAGRRCLGMYVLKRKEQAGFGRDETALLAIPPWLNFC